MAKTRNISFAALLPGVSHALTLRARMLRKALDETADMSDKRETSSALQTCPYEKRASARASGDDNGIAPERQSAHAVLTNLSKLLRRLLRPDDGNRESREGELREFVNVE